MNLGASRVRRAILERQSRFAARGRHGQASIEAALVLVTFILLFVSLFDFGRMFLTYQALQNGVRSGARMGSTGRTLGAYDRERTIKAAVVDAAKHDIPLADIMIENIRGTTRSGGPGGSNDTLIVSAAYDVPVYSPWLAVLFGSHYRVRVQTAVRNEDFEGVTYPTLLTTTTARTTLTATTVTSSSTVSSTAAPPTTVTTTSAASSTSTGATTSTTGRASTSTTRVATTSTTGRASTSTTRVATTSTTGRASTSTTARPTTTTRPPTTTAPPTTTTRPPTTTAPPTTTTRPPTTTTRPPTTTAPPTTTTLPFG